MGGGASTYLKYDVFKNTADELEHKQSTLKEEVADTKSSLVSR
eukprot:SAG11_NODE_37958_length_254_cov_1.000000_1_plen_42_part_01